MYQRAGGGKPGDAWCSWFVSWCLRQAHVATAYFGRARSWFDARHTIWTNGHSLPGCPAPRPNDLPAKPHAQPSVQQFDSTAAASWAPRLALFRP